MKVFDTFLLGSGPQDLDLLECRLYELGDCGLIYRHVIVEGCVTFTGLPKPMYYADHRSRFAAWADKIRYVPIMPTTSAPGKQPGDAWAREHSSRHTTMVGLMDAGPDDVIIHGDCDELLTTEAVGQLDRGLADLPKFRLRLRHFSFAVDWEQPKAWYAPSVTTMRHLGSLTDLREGPPGEPGPPVWELPSGHRAGWHLSWLGGLDAMTVKLHSFSHTERVAEIEAGIGEGKYLERGLFWREPGEPGGDYPLMPVDVDASWPRWIAEGKCPASWFRPRAGWAKAAEGGG